jgi:hypothetical protein
MDIYGKELMGKAQTFDRVWNWDEEMRTSYPEEYEKVCKQYATGDFDPSNKEIERYRRMWFSSLSWEDRCRRIISYINETEKEKLEREEKERLESEEMEKESIKKIYIMYMFVHVCKSRRNDSTGKSAKYYSSKLHMCLTDSDYTREIKERIFNVYLTEKYQTIWNSIK